MVLLKLLWLCFVGCHGSFIIDDGDHATSSYIQLKRLDLIMTFNVYTCLSNLQLIEDMSLHLNNRVKDKCCLGMNAAPTYFGSLCILLLLLFHSLSC